MKNITVKKNKTELKALATQLECLRKIRKYTKRLAQTFKPKKGRGAYKRKEKFQ